MSVASSIRSGVRSAVRLDILANGWPRSATEMRRACGDLGTWTNGLGYLCDEASGSLAPAFGATSLAPTGTVTYGVAGPLGGADKAVAFPGVNDRFDGGNIADVTAADDLLLVWSGYSTATPVTTNDFLFSKMTTGAGWQVGYTTTGNFYFQAFDATPTTLFTANGVAPTLNTWHVGAAAMDRATGKARIALRSLATGASSATAEQNLASSSMSNAIAFRFGERADNSGGAPTSMRFGGFYVVSGPGVAAGCSANLQSLLSSFASYLVG